MNFFQHQEAARKRTGVLLVLLFAAVACLILITVFAVGIFLYFLSANSTSMSAVAAHQTPLLEHLWQLLHSPLTLWISIAVITVVIGGSLVKLIALGRGGKSVAEALGGRRLDPGSSDATERKILNIVEEMAIASGNPVPLVYLLEDDSINAFAAGLSRHDAVIGVTRGCVARLSRDELQGVVAHEFSHIHNGDMRLNMRLIAILHGILVIGLLGHLLVRGSGYGRRRDGRQVSLGFALIVIGYSGTFFGNLIKAAISRQREFLADASAVQFTRNPSGIGGALKKIGGWPAGSQLSSAHAEEFSHLYFGQGIRTQFSSLMATHPALGERIKRIDPHWQGQFPQVTDEIQSSSPEAEAQVSRFSNTATPIPFAADALASIGDPSPRHIDLADRILGEIPQSLHDAAHQAFSARALVYGLLLDRHRTDIRNHQLTLLKQSAHPATYKELEIHLPVLLQLHRNIYLPLLSLCIPSLKNQSKPQYQVFKTNLGLMIRADRQISLFEWSLYRICTRNIEEKTLTGKNTLAQHQSASVFLFTALSRIGNNDNPLLALNKGMATLGWPLLTSLPQQDISLKIMDKALDQLESLRPLEKPSLLKALLAIITADKQVTHEEKEVFRAVADTLDCPVPPLE